MKRLGDIGKEKRREWHWCRRENDFSARRKWHVIAARVRLRPTDVIAFVNRLEEIGNAAEQRGHERGVVSDYSIEELAAELGLAADDAARVYAALEQEGWIDPEGMLGTFHRRNPDREDPTAPLRDRRRRTRDHVLKELARLGRLGRIDAARRAEIETSLKLLPDAELFALPATVAQLELTALSTEACATRVPRRGTVSLTPEQSRGLSPVDNPGREANVAAAGLSEQEQAELWLASEGVRVIYERLSKWDGKDVADATNRMLRWRDQKLGGDAARLVTILRGADDADYVGARFHNQVTAGIDAAVREGAPQRELRLAVPLVNERKLG